MLRVSTVLSLMLAASSAHAGVLLSDSFDRVGPLHGSSPDVGADPWIAGDAWTTDGAEAVIAPREGEHAFLPFTPVAGEYYVLSATYTLEDLSVAPWFALGFTPNTGPLNQGYGAGANFHESGRSPASWALLRHNGETFSGAAGGLAQTGFFPRGVPTTIEVCIDSRDPTWRGAVRIAGTPTQAANFGGIPNINFAAFGTEFDHRNGTVDNFQLETLADPDPDGDGVPHCEDLCFGDDALGDADGDGICDPPVELCDGIDNDGDGLADEYDACDCRSRGYFGKTYDACLTGVTQENAASACPSWGHELLQLETDLEHNTIGSALQIRLWPFRAWWIGLDDRTAEGTYTWLDGTPLTDSNWAAGQPATNDANDCVGIFPLTMSWYERNCEVNHGFVCESP